MQSNRFLLFAYLQGRCRWAHRQHIFEWRHRTWFKGKLIVVTPALIPPWLYRAKTNACKLYSFVKLVINNYKWTKNTKYNYKLSNSASPVPLLIQACRLEPTILKGLRNWERLIAGVDKWNLLLQEQWIFKISLSYHITLTHWVLDHIKMWSGMSGTITLD